MFIFNPLFLQDHDLDHFLIQFIKVIIDSTNSCPFEVSLYSTLGGISL